MSILYPAGQKKGYECAGRDEVGKRLGVGEGVETGWKTYEAKWINCSEPRMTSFYFSKVLT